MGRLGGGSRRHFLRQREALQKAEAGRWGEGATASYGEGMPCCSAGGGRGGREREPPCQRLKVAAAEGLFTWPAPKGERGAGKHSLKHSFMTGNWLVYYKGPLM